MENRWLSPRNINLGTFAGIAVGIEVEYDC